MTNTKQGIPVVISGIIILMCLGVAYSWGVFIVPINQEMSWSRATISFAVSILLLVFSAFMAIGGICEKRIGPRLTATIGGLLVGSGWYLASFATTPLWLYLSYGLLVGIGTGLCYMTSISSGIRWYPTHRGLVTGLIVFGFGFGTAFVSPLSTLLISEFGWRSTMQLLGLAFSILIITAAQFIKSPLQENISIQTNTLSNDLSPYQMLRTKTFKVLFVSYLLAMTAGMLTIGHLISFIIDHKFSAIQAALALTVLSLFNGAGRILFGYLSDIFGGKRILNFLFISMGFSVLSLSFIEILPAIYVIAALTGLFFGGFLAVYPPLTLSFFGAKDFSVNYGFVFIGYGLGCFLGPLLGGYIYDIALSYDLAFVISFVLAISGGLLIRFRLK